MSDFRFDEWTSPPEHYNFAIDVMERWARERPDALALWWVSGDGSRKLERTFAELADDFRRASDAFRRLGIGKGDRVLVVLPRIPEWWVALLGLIRLGAVPIPGTTQLTEKDIAYRLDVAQVKAVVLDDDGAQKMPEFSGPRVLVGGEREGWTSFDAALRDASPDFAPEPTKSRDDGILYFTSGTTGPPKMVLHDQVSYGLAHRITGELWLDAGPDDVHWCLTDTGWAKAAWSILYGPWLAGACVFTRDLRGKFDPKKALETLRDYPITIWCAPPTVLRLVVKQDLAAYRFPHLRHCVSAGEPLNPEVIEEFAEATGLSIHDGYGQTEAVCLVANHRSLGHAIRPGSMGMASPGYEIAILGEDLEELPAGEEGEVAVRVKPQRPLGLFVEYWNHPEENALRFRGDWYLTGDRATRDEDGYFWFVGRDDDVITSAGYRIGPFEVESALLEHPAVVESAAVGKPDPERGEIVQAYVVLGAGHTPSEGLVRELQEHCKRVTAPYKYPRAIEFVSELPKTISGKIRRVELRARARES